MESPRICMQLDFLSPWTPATSHAPAWIQLRLDQLIILRGYKYGKVLLIERFVSSPYHLFKLLLLVALSAVSSTMLFYCLLALSLGLGASASSVYRRVNSSNPWYLERFSNFIVFGDSYTDESRLGYFINHNGSAPPPGTYLPEVSRAPYKPSAVARH